MKLAVLFSLILFGQAFALAPYDKMEESVDVSYWFTTQHKQFFGEAKTHGFMVAKNYKFKLINAFDTTSSVYFSFGYNGSMAGNSSDFEYKYTNTLLALKQTVNYTTEKFYKFSMAIGIGYGRQSLTSNEKNALLDDGDSIISQDVAYDLNFQFEFRNFKDWIPFISYGYVNFKTGNHDVPNGVKVQDLTTQNDEEFDLSYKYYYLGFRKII